MTNIATQVADPWKAAKRTAVAVLAAAAPVLLILAQMLSMFAESFADMLPGGAIAWALAASAVLSTVAAYITRVMAIPGVNEFLAKLGLKAEPAEEVTVPQEFKTVFKLEETAKSPKHRKEG